MKRLLLVFTLFNIGVASAQLKTYNGSFEDGLQIILIKKMD